ncbi:AfsR/SARP family transcriptional regulator [Saccharothrix variisporea]|uniref:DNA-binding SARP family transcriptional activator n=1 Tax=Saccharothrix variisporea TaxID=543527 RepID=A0A495XHB2_9PSEU|nr:BTAD domain-containing putative transcriptional regulator [Saccharothrix variisporea]RKT72154.1 DNA-binding SARP family transcriptional activator [Saccharothrix variisporea]
MTMTGKGGVEFRVLGPLEVEHAGEVVPVPPGKSRVLLALLLLRANQVVSADELVDRMWSGISDHRRALATLHMAITRLRHALRPVDVIRTVTAGYRAEVGEGALDLDRFRELAHRGSYAAALAQWRGEPLADVPQAPLGEYRALLDEERLSVLERRIDADLAVGHPGRLVTELRDLVIRYPLRERFRAQLMTALHQSGETAAALAVYEESRLLLAEELGLDPDLRLRALHQRIVAGSGVPDLRLPDGLAGVPRLALVDELSNAVDEGFPLLALVGPEGVGKTALAVQWAGAVRASFPDGTLFLDLRGHRPDPVDAAEAARAVLVACGVPAERVPHDPEERFALYRSVLADRRALLVLDAARDADHVRPLLPGTPSCVVVVISRHPLVSLVATHGAHPVAVGAHRTEMSEGVARY